MVRYKKRYFLVEVIPENNRNFQLQDEVFSYVIQQKVQQLHGDFGSAALKGFLLKSCSPKLRLAVIRMQHGPHKILASTLPFITKIKTENVVVHSLYTGATLRHCFKFLKKYQQSKIHSDLESAKGTPEYEELRKAYMWLAKVTLNM